MLLQFPWGRGFKIIPLIDELRSDSRDVSLFVLMLDNTLLNFLFDLLGRARVTFRCMTFVLASDGVNSAASIASRTVSIGARFRMVTAFANLSDPAKLVPDMMKERCS